jgi:hypothetical protein
MSDPYDQTSPMVLMIRDPDVQRDLVLAAMRLNLSEDQIVERVVKNIFELHLLEKFLDGEIRKDFEV